MLAPMLRALLMLALLLAACEAEPERTVPASPSPSPIPSPATPAPSPITSPAERACVDATTAALARVVMLDFEFRPDCLVVLGGQGLILRNRGGNLHNLTIESSQVGIDVTPGDVARTEAVSLPAGTYTFYCIYHQGQGMVGELTVTEAG